MEAAPDGAWTGWRPFRIVAAAPAARDVVSFRLVPQDGLPLPPFRGGQHVALRAGPAGARRVRCYSLSSLPDAGGYRLTVKRVGGGEMSGFLHALSPPFAAAVELMAPRGDFCIAPGAAGEAFPVVLIAGGIGITPLLSMLHQLRRDGWPAPIDLLYSVRSASAHAFAEEILDLQKAMPRLRVTTFYSRPEPADLSSAACDVAGRLSAAHLAGVAAPAARFYVCGPAEMIAFVMDALARLGVGAERRFAEGFGPPCRRLSGAALAPQPVRLVRSGRTFFWRPGGPSLLELAEDAGVNVMSNCRAGQCDACAAKLLAGEVDCPGREQPAADECFLCVAQPLTPLIIDL